MPRKLTDSCVILGWGILKIYLFESNSNCGQYILKPHLLTRNRAQLPGFNAVILAIFRRFKI